MDAWSNAFEKRWTIVFLFFYFFIMLPLPFYYDTAYNPSLWGVPLFIFGWLAHALVVMILIVIFAKQALSRPEYQDEYLDKLGEE